MQNISVFRAHGPVTVRLICVFSFSLLINIHYFLDER